MDRGQIYSGENAQKSIGGYTTIPLSNLLIYITKISSPTMRILSAYKRYKLAYRNYTSVMYNIYRKKNYIKVILRGGGEHNWISSYCTNYSFYYYYDLGNIQEYSDKKAEFLEFTYNDKKIKLCGVREGGGDLFGVFIQDDYKFLNVENQVIIDIGANIGDSSIYFALNNAKKVIALEPYPFSYNFAVKNIDLNGQEDKIILLNAGYGLDSNIIVDKNKVTNAGSSLIQSNIGKKIRIYSLKSLITDHGLSNDIILKMDCEGCEYALLEEETDTLRKFRRIQIEYHYGYDQLVNKLKENHFKVRFTEPIKRYNKDATNNKMLVGILYAERY